MIDALKKLWTSITKSKRESALRSSRAALQAELNEIKRAYLAAKTTGPNKNWRASSGTADAEIRIGSKKVRDRIRDLGRNSPYIAGAKRRYVANTVGEGNYPQSKVRNPDGLGLNTQVTRKIEDNFMLWAADCGINGDSLSDIQSTALDNFLQDGEAIIIKSVVDGRLKLQIIEPEQLNEMIDGPLPGENMGIKGVEIDKYGRPVAYHIYDANPGEWFLSSMQSRRVDAKSVCHVFRRERATQHRGISRFASVVMQMFDIGEYTDATMILAKIATAYGVFIETPNAEDWMQGGNTATSTDSDNSNQREISLRSGAINILQPGEKPHFSKPEQPGPVYESFVRANLRAASVGTGMSYSAFSGDYSQGNFSSERQAMLLEKALFRMDCGLFDRKFNEPVFCEWLDLEVLSGRISLPGYWSRRAEYQRVKFSRPRQEYINPLQEISAFEKEVLLGTRSRTEIIEDRGADTDDVFNSLSEEKKQMGALAITESPMSAVIEETEGATAAAEGLMKWLK